MHTASEGNSCTNGKDLKAANLMPEERKYVSMGTESEVNRSNKTGLDGGIVSGEGTGRRAYKTCRAMKSDMWVWLVDRGFIGFSFVILCALNISGTSNLIHVLRILVSLRHPSYIC
jgi:hypothetical protein